MNSIAQELNDMNKRCKGAFDGIILERIAQENKFGKQDHDIQTWLAILLEEVGEVAHAINETRLTIDQRVPPSIRQELIQVAAVVCAMIENYDRERRWSKESMFELKSENNERKNNVR